jgi:molecular chaperone DnaK (HSP70)
MLIFDLGGGTFDVSLLTIQDGIFEVKATGGDTHLGGDDFDQVLIDYIAEEFKKENQVDLRKDPMAMQRLKDEGEKVKKYLSTQSSAEVNLPFITAIDGVPKHINLSITRSQFERMVEHLIDRCKKPVLRALEDAQVPSGKIFTAADIMSDPQYQARGLIQKVTLEDGRELTVPGVVPRLSKTPGQVRGRGPRLGEHNGSGFDPA